MTTAMMKVEQLEAAPLTYHGEKVITLALVDALHGRPAGTAGRNFRKNRKHLSEGLDYHEARLDEFRPVGGALDLLGVPGSGPQKVVLLTESGYSLLVKSFRDDLAWEVQRKLVRGYFRKKDSLEALVEQLRAELATMKATQAALIDLSRVQASAMASALAHRGAQKRLEKKATRALEAGQRLLIDGAEPVRTIPDLRPRRPSRRRPMPPSVGEASHG